MKFIIVCIKNYFFPLISNNDAKKYAANTTEYNTYEEANTAAKTLNT